MKKSGIFLLVFIIGVAIIPVSAGNFAQVKQDDDNGVVNRVRQVQPEGLILHQDQLIKIDEDFPGLGTSEDGSSRAITHLHPALGDAANDTLIRGYQNHEGLPNGYIWWNGSGDNGATWQNCCAWDLYGASYPSVGYAGSGSLWGPLASSRCCARSPRAPASGPHPFSAR